MSPSASGPIVSAVALAPCPPDAPWIIVIIIIIIINY